MRLFVYFIFIFFFRLTRHASTYHAYFNTFSRVSCFCIYIYIYPSIWNKKSAVDKYLRFTLLDHYSSSFLLFYHVIMNFFFLRLGNPLRSFISIQFIILTQPYRKRERGVKVEGKSFRRYESKLRVSKCSLIR